MANINLLPWRDEHRQEKKKEFLGLLGLVVILAAVFAFGWNLTANDRLDDQFSRNQLLKSNIAALDKQVSEIKDLKKRRQDLLDRMEVIQNLQGNRPDIVKIYDEFVRAVPDGVYFTKMERKGKEISLTGFAESNNRVSALMRKLDEAGKFVDPNLTVVEANQALGEQGSKFEMRVKLEDPQPSSVDAQGGA
ncbi:MAG: PilN domain-containing protein [Porticoccaceae bacterium]|nr:PilN domain-containing protein [Pseudomonadales bacterium]MCP5170988.1 PilN domain-containing protein [Pseudomonadales bacterium]MCP5301774.1 PilN domain-containing protein [Pseudomonadales bacterium]